MNPFLKNEVSQNYYADFVFSQVKNTEIGQSLQVDLGGKSTPDFRMTLRYVCDRKLNGFRFKTKVSSDGALWIKRVS